MSGVVSPWLWPLRLNEGFLVEGTAEILRVAVAQGYRTWDSIDIEQNGVIVASTEATGESKAELVGPWSITSQAYGAGESGWSGDASVSLPSSLLAGPDGVADPLSGATIRIYVAWERLEYGIAPSYVRGNRLYRLPLGTLQVADSVTKMTMDGRFVAQLQLIDPLQALDSYPIPESSSFVGSGYHKPGVNINYTPEGLAYLLAEEAGPKIASEYIDGRPGIFISDPELVGLSVTGLDAPASTSELEGQTYLSAIRATLQPYGLIGLMTRQGEFSVRYPEDRAASFSVDNDDIATSSESMDNYTFNGVQASTGSIDSASVDGELYAFNTNAVAPMHVDPANLVSSALAPPRILNVPSGGLTADALGAAIELQASRIAHPQALSVTLRNPQAIEVLDVAWIDIDGFEKGRYVVTSVTQSSSAALETSFTARRMATT